MMTFPMAYEPEPVPWAEMTWSERRTVIALALAPWPKRVDNVIMWTLFAIFWFTGVMAMIEVWKTAIGFGFKLFLTVVILDWIINGAIRSLQKGLKARLDDQDRLRMERLLKMVDEAGIKMADQFGKRVGRPVAADPISLAVAAIEINESADNRKGNPFKAILDGDLHQADKDLREPDEPEDGDPNKEW
jgi:hypothetical protein